MTDVPYPCNPLAELGQAHGGHLMPAEFEQAIEETPTRLERALGHEQAAEDARLIDEGYAGKSLPPAAREAFETSVEQARLDPARSALAANPLLGREDYFTRENLLRLFASAPTAFWRFDVDLSLELAREMAEVAQLGGVEATFCLQVRSGFYNLFGPEGRYTVESIVNRGHRVAPHVLEREHVGEDLALFERAFDIRRSFVSFHMPGPDVLWRDFRDFDHAHASRWEGHYLSDSRGEPLSRVPVASDQVALHAEWWFR